MSLRARAVAVATAVVGICALTLPLPAAVSVPVDRGGGAVAPAEVMTTPQLHADTSRATRTELRELARAWADGGGTFGYPFWGKAQQRWRTGEITASMFREYVTGYRDRVMLGCDLLEDVETSTEVSGDVRELVVQSCRSRLDGLREQQRALDDLIRSAGGAEDADIESLDESQAEHEAAAREAFQDSYRRARLAMDLAQLELEGAGLDPIDEGSFI